MAKLIIKFDMDDIKDLIVDCIKEVYNVDDVKKEDLAFEEFDLENIIITYTQKN